MPLATSSLCFVYVQPTHMQLYRPLLAETLYLSATITDDSDNLCLVTCWVGDRCHHPILAHPILAHHKCAVYFSPDIILL